MGIFTGFGIVGFYIYLFKNREKIKLAVSKGNGQKLLKPISNFL